VTNVIWGGTSLISSDDDSVIVQRVFKYYQHLRKRIFPHVIIRNSSGKEEHEYPSTPSEVEQHSQNGFGSAPLDDSYLTLLGIHIKWVKY